MKGLHRSFSSEVTAAVQFGGAQPFEINDPMLGRQVFRPDQSTAYVQFQLSHAFPVVTKDKTGIHPQVVANSYQSLRNKVFNLAHIMRAYNPEQFARDRILGMIVAVEFPEAPAGGWAVNYEKENAPGIKAVAAIIKAAEGVADILETFERGTTPWGGQWAVSMENYHTLERCGFLIAGSEGCEDFSAQTPTDLAERGHTYVPAGQAPLELLQCLNNDEDDATDGDNSTRIKRQFNGQDTLFLIGGLTDTIHYSGTGLTPFPKEEEAHVAAMMASQKLHDLSGIIIPDFCAPMRNLLAIADVALGKKQG
jgi:hypothetical protein